MKRNKKLISLICTIAMIFSMLSGLAITASADSEGYTITNATLSNDGLTATFDVGYTGFENGITNGGFTIVLPTDASNIKNVKAANGEAFNKITVGKSNYPSVAFSFTAALDDDNKPMATKAADKICTVTVEYNNAFPATTDIVIANGSYINTSTAAEDKYTVGAESGKTMSSATAQIVNTNVPTPKPTTSTTPVPVATEKPADPDKPVVVDPVTPEKGYTLSTPVVSDDGLTITFDAGYTGFENGVTNGGFTIVFPTDASNIKNVKATNSDVFNKITVGKSSYPSVAFSFTAALDDDNKPMATKAADKICTVELTLNGKLPYDTNIVIADDSYLNTSTAAADKYTVGADGDHGLTAAKQVIKAVGSSEEEPQTVVGTVDLDKAITTTVDDAPDATTKESDYFIIPKVTVTENGTTKDATYGEQGDYVAVIGDTVLTPAQYSNLINGHLGADNVKDIVAANNINNINDVISKIGLRVYNSTAKISAQLVNRTTGEIENGDDDEVAVDTKGETTNYAASTVKLAKTNTQNIKTNAGKQTNTLTVTTGKDKDGNDRDFGTLTFQLDEASLEALTLAGVVITYTGYADDDYGVATAATADTETVTVKVADDEPVVLGESTDGKYTITFTPGAKGTVEYTATYYGYNKKGEAETQTATVTYKITEPSSSGGSSSSSKDNTSSGGGAIASGLVDSGSSYLPNLGFDDLGDVTWAQTAINTLAAKKIVSGVGDNKFDPNAALTRAAYAQMLVNAIGHSTDSADTYFDDVPTDAWFYHNVAVASQLGIVSGFGDGTFRPNDLITREQMALMTQKAAVVMGKSLVGADVGTFTDDADIADWSRDAVYTLANAGIINGMGDGTFAPQANATRAQAAVIIYNAFVK